MQKVHKNDDKFNAKGSQKASRKASRASKMSPAASRRRPRASKKRPGGAKLDLLVFYSVFKRPRSSGGMRCRALITYRLGRSESAQISNFSAHSRKPALLLHALVCRRARCGFKGVNHASIASWDAGEAFIVAIFGSTVSLASGLEASRPRCLQQD